MLPQSVHLDSEGTNDTPTHYHNEQDSSTEGPIHNINCQLCNSIQSSAINTGNLIQLLMAGSFMIMQFMKYVVRNEIGLCAPDEMHAYIYYCAHHWAVL